MTTETRKELTEGARRALKASEGADHPVAESEMIFERFCSAMGYLFTEEQRRDVLDCVAEGKRLGNFIIMRSR